ncbi:hypothetical protein PMJ10TS2_25720 [Paenibacillus melissococcoides]
MSIIRAIRADTLRCAEWESGEGKVDMPIHSYAASSLPAMLVPSYQATGIAPAQGAQHSYNHHLYVEGGVFIHGAIVERKTRMLSYGKFTPAGRGIPA